MSVGYARPEALVSTEWVVQHLNDPSIAIIEVDTVLRDGYGHVHVPGAVGWSLHDDLEAQTRRDLPTLADLEGLMGRSGIDNDTTVVVYGDGNNRSATWAFWVLKYYRHGDVRLMNGGRKRWLGEGRPLSSDAPVPIAKAYRAGVPDRSLRATRDHILSGLRNRSARLVDTRTYEEYAGRIDATSGAAGSEIYRQGHILDAVHVPWDDGATKDGTFKPAEELRRIYEHHGVTSDQEVIPYCRLGVRASYTWFVLKYLLGYGRVRNYDGSWTEWGNSVGVPIEAIAETGPA
jgi:thiosulfate/3-mercaptopyruvate sulfurtransferase